MNEQTNNPLPPSLTPLKLVVIFACLLGATLAVMGVCVLFGQTSLTWLVLELRLGRLIAAALVGAGLSVGGMALQAILRNPLAEPYLLGISSGAGVGVLIGMATVGMFPLWMASVPAPMFAFVGAMVTCVLVYLIAQQRGRLNAQSLILSGVIVNVFNGAIMLAINLYISRYQIVEFSQWMMGEINELTPRTTLGICAACILVGWAWLFIRSAAYNALGLGDDVARSMGISVGRLRIETFVFVSLMAGAAVALAGPIGFVGLIIPHIARLLLRADFRVLIITSGFIGAIFLMIVETACYALAPLVNVASIPVGIVTALCGGPFFLMLLRRGLRRETI
ncbi:MAG: iron ABC transporter permease [Phycisphaerae bacterium]|nr:iron ABC transporter permease [Phycisphaerae bacterium]